MCARGQHIEEAIGASLKMMHRVAPAILDARIVCSLDIKTASPPPASHAPNHGVHGIA